MCVVLAVFQPWKQTERDCPDVVCVNALQLVSGQAVGTLFDLEESQYMQERMEAERQNQGSPSIPVPASWQSCS